MRRSLASLALVVLVACGDGSTTAPTNDSVAGTWSLQSINGTGLPYIILQTGADKVEIVSDVVVAAASGSFTQTTTVRTTVSGQATTQSQGDGGTWSLNGTAVTFQFTGDGSTGTGSISGNTMTVAESGFAFVYRKQ